MPVPLTANEEAQTLQTIEMFEVIAQSDPSDHLALEILRESYFKLHRPADVLRTSKRIAQAYVRSGQLSSAMLEFESIQQSQPNDPEVTAALADIENKANQIAAPPMPAEADLAVKPSPDLAKSKGGGAAVPAAAGDDGRAAMYRVLVDGKQISPSDFDLYWPSAKSGPSAQEVVEPFIQTLAEKQLLPLERSLKLLSEKSRLAYLPLEKCDVDMELARSFPRAICQRWCILPFDRMSKSVLVATANPFNKQAIQELSDSVSDAGTKHRLLWYVASPVELMKILRKVFR